MDQKVSRAIRTARRYADGGDVDERSTFRRALDTGMDYAGRGLALADLYSGGMLSSAAGLVPGNSIANAQAARDRALEGVPREAKALAVEPVTPYAAIFAGPMARTANRKMLQRAEELAAQNAPREQIWNETGWFKGVDGKWRFEIDDSQAHWTPELKKHGLDAGSGLETYAFGFGRQPLQGDLFIHRELYDAYPGAEKIGLRAQKGGSLTSLGSYDPTGNIELNTLMGDSGMRSTNLHEFQHAIQKLEDFSPGANPKQFRKVEGDRVMLTDANVLARIMSGGKSIDQARDEFAMVMGRSPALGAESVALSGEKPDSILARRAALLDPDEAYRRSTGEVEARTVQKRMDLTPAQRRARAPWLDYDVPEQDQIVRFR